MARARNIKPAFFDNDLLADIDPLGRLLFIGLWTIADYKGDLVYREKRIKAQLLPYDNCDVKNIMINLDKSGFIRFYSDGDSIYLNIANFSKHQNPHKNERQKGSDIPEYSESMAQAVDLSTLTINRDKNGTAHDNNETNRADSLLLIPDSLSPITDSQVESKTCRFAEFWDLYGKKVDRPKCEKKFSKISESDIELIFDQLPLYIKSKPEKQYRKDPIRWLTGECWNDDIIQPTNHAKSTHSFTEQNYQSGKF